MRQAWCRHNAVRDARKRGGDFPSMRSGQFGVTPDRYKYLSSPSIQKERDIHDGICWESSESSEEEQVLSFVLNMVENLLALFLFSSPWKVEK